jgi:hypothetical protein
VAGIFYRWATDSTAAIASKGRQRTMANCDFTRDFFEAGNGAGGPSTHSASSVNVRERRNASSLVFPSSGLFDSIRRKRVRPYLILRKEKTRKE